jgi:hypothetical protein
VEPWLRTALLTWAAHRSSGVPLVSDLETADPRLVRAGQILDFEADLIAMANQDTAKRRADLAAKAGGRRG